MRVKSLCALLISLGVVGSCGEAGVWTSQKSGPPDRYVTAVVDRGPIRDIVPALGRIRPANEVEVGAEVGGRIIEVAVDFDDRVERGQILARLDPEPFQAALVRADAGLRTASANREEAAARLRAGERELERASQLADRGAGAAARAEDLSFDVDQLRAAFERAEAGVELARAQRDEARINLGRTEIHAPIDGFVLDKQVQEGQTINAAFSTPVLFVIAADLAEVVIEARVAEADIARVSEGMEVRFRVDAYPRQVFRGQAGAVRRSPDIDGRFISYLVMISANDDQQRLLPGMTASVEFVAADAFHVLRAPREALTPVMTPDFIEMIDPALLPEDLQERIDRTQPGWQGGVRGALAGRAMGRGFREGRNLRILHQVVGDRFGYVEIEVGAEDDTYFEILNGDIQEGDRVLVHDLGADAARR